MHLDDWLLLVHIVAAGTWLGAGVVLFLLGRYAISTGTESKIIKQYEWVGPRIGGPVTILIPVTGIWMVARGPWDFSDLWIILGLVLFAVMLALAFGAHMPNYRRIASADDRGDSSRVLRLSRRGFALAGVEVAVLLFMFAVMVWKP